MKKIIIAILCLLIVQAIKSQTVTSFYGDEAIQLNEIDIWSPLQNCKVISVNYVIKSGDSLLPAPKNAKEVIKCIRVKPLLNKLFVEAVILSEPYIKGKDKKIEFGVVHLICSDGIEMEPLDKAWLIDADYKTTLDYFRVMLKKIKVDSPKKKQKNQKKWKHPF